MTHCPSCGVVIEADPKSRSTPQHNRYWAMVRAAYQHWPETHEFQPATLEQLRKWLQCKAGHYHVQSFELPQTDDPALMARMMAFAEALLDTRDGSRFGRWHGTVLSVFVPKSIAFDRLSHKAACQLFDEVAAVIEAEIGIDHETLLKETEGAA